MAENPVTEYLTSLTPPVRDTAERLIFVVTRQASFDVAMKWRQLTFALDRDFDHWICAVAANARQARLAFHFGALLDDPAGAFAASDAKFVRRINYASTGDVDEAVVADLLTQAIETLPRFLRVVHAS